MGFDMLSGTTERVLTKALDAASLRHEAISENLANVDTPGYKRGDVRFESMLREALAESDAAQAPLARTDPRHLPATGSGAIDSVRPELFRDTNTKGRTDGNNVDIDAEMAKLAENSILYNTLTQVLGRRMGMIRSAIFEGRR